MRSRVRILRSIEAECAEERLKSLRNEEERLLGGAKSGFCESIFENYMFVFHIVFTLLGTA